MSVKIHASLTSVLAVDMHVSYFFLNLIIVHAVNRGDNNNMFTIGQTLRIRIGPLKGYICRVIALRRADVTVKLDSQQKVLTGLFMMVNSSIVS